MSIEWGNPQPPTYMGATILDNSGAPPTDVLEAGQPFKIEVKWSVPSALLPFLNPAGDAFRLRAFAESVGPGQEIQIGGTDVVPAVAGQLSYQHTLNVTNNQLTGEGGVFNGVPVSGVYNIVVVLQHLSVGVPTIVSGFSEYPNTVMFKLP